MLGTLEFHTHTHKKNSFKPVIIIIFFIYFFAVVCQ